ncbi:MAG: NAD(P)-dependent alcohol dehydrogenase [Actinomycetota bacterium]|nr:NAD(P)-dependent alcohol dehydrogenase [Actinomycetota bacterium]
MITVHARATDAAGAPFHPASIERRALGPRDVLIDIAFAGICHSDIHTARGEWGAVRYPLVPGHEIAGTVAAIGTEVESFAVGDRIGVGCFVDSCRRCVNCLAGEEQYCRNGATFTYNSIGRDGQPTSGGYCDRFVVDERYALHLPEALPLEATAPLLCAGITMYSPLRRWGAGAGRKVAIVGMGGLGHMGVKIAHAMGAEVTVLSHSLTKRQDGRRLGASHYAATSDPSTFEELAHSQDLIVSTLSAHVELEPYLGLLALDGAYVNVGLPEVPVLVDTTSLGRSRVAVSGSMIGGIRETQEMLDFCGAHGIGAEVEVIGAGDIDKAYDRVVASDVRYRFVIDASTFA